MVILKAEQLAKSWKDKLIFDNVNIEISEGEHVALIGNNGVGKTTLFELLLRQTEADQGTVYRALPVEEWGWMEQQLQVEEEVSLLEFVQSGIPELYNAKLELQKLQSELSLSQQLDPQRLDSLMERYSDLYERYEAMDGYGWEMKVERYLNSFQLYPESWPVPFMQLSGGQKTRAQLARLLVKQPKFILLDEPTNHLDQASLEWLEQWIRDYTGAVLFVSHDRHFIDAVAHATYELTAKGATKYKGGYSDFRRQRQLEIETQQRLYDKQEREKNQLLETIRMYQQWFQSAHRDASQNDFWRAKANKHTARFRAKEKSLERLENNRVEQPKDAPKLQVEFIDAEFEARTLVSLKDVSFAYGDRTLFSGLNLAIERGDRFALIGPNGAGKSTLLKLLTGELAAAEGSVLPHPRLKIGYFAQELEGLNHSETILESLLTVPNMTQTYARTILGCFLFRRDDVHKTIGSLSMGEKCRVAFVRLYFSGANLLVLDEPTNYLDIDTRERIEQALQQYPGALIIVSHDRYLTRKVANRIADLNGGKVQLFPGTYDEYLERLHNRGASSSQLNLMNEIRRLELRLTQLMSQDEPESGDDKSSLISEIRETRALLNKLTEQYEQERK